MSSNASCALLSATFHEPGYQHLIELIHQRDPAAHRRLAAVDLTVYDADGGTVLTAPLDPQLETFDLAAALDGVTAAAGRLMAVFDARYDERVFPYRPHHYGYLHARGSALPSLYYAVNAVLGGVPDRIGTTSINNFETYLFRRGGGGDSERYAVVVGNLSRYATAEAQVFTYRGAERTARTVTLAPKAHAEVGLEDEHGAAIDRVEIKGLFRLATYVVGRRSKDGELVLFDHLFPYTR
jgi:hypothetical protein